MELWDGYNRDGSLAGVDLKRGEPLPAGVYHMGVEILVMHKDGTYLLMQRDLNKFSHPGQFETSMGGCVKKGEKPLEAAHRELLEETGLDTDVFNQIVYTVTDRNQTIIYGYLVNTDRPKDSITLQEGETISYKWLNEEDFIRHINSEEAIKSQVERFTPYFKTLNYIK